MITFEVDAWSLVLMGFLHGLLLTSFMLILVDTFFRKRDR